MIQLQGALILIQKIDCRSHELTAPRFLARLPRLTVAAIDLERVIQILWLLFNQSTVNGDKNVSLAVF